MELFAIAAAMLQDGQEAARVKAAAAVDQESPTYGLSMRHAADSKSHHLTRGEDGGITCPNLLCSDMEIISVSGSPLKCVQCTHESLHCLICLLYFDP